jgi:hypothetical protein
MKLEWKPYEGGGEPKEVCYIGGFRLMRWPDDPGYIDLWLWAEPYHKGLELISRKTPDEAEAAALTWIRETCTATLTALGDAS